MSSTQNSTVGTVPPPSGVGMIPPPTSVGMTPPPMGTPGSTPPPMNGIGMAPPPMGGIGMVPPSTSSAPERPARNQAKGRGKKGISTQAIISDQILSAQEYRNIQSNVIKYLKDSNRNMTSTVIGQGQLCIRRSKQGGYGLQKYIAPQCNDQRSKLGRSGRCFHLYIGLSSTCRDC